MAQAAKATDLDATEPMWSVIDTNAKESSRTHHPLGLGRESITFNPGKRTEMPQEIAVKFLCDPAFLVYNEAGARVTSLRKPTAEDAKQGIVLEADEVIAKLDELGQEALLLRAHLQPGGEVFKKNAKRDDLIEFLKATRDRDPSAPGSIGAAKRGGKAASDAADAGDAADGDGEEMSDGELDAMLSGGE